MTKSLDELPSEILQIIIRELTSEHHVFIVPLAKTYNKIIYDACSRILKLRRSIPADKLAICDIFYKEYNPGWAYVYGQDRIYNIGSCFNLDGRLTWLDEIVCDIRDYDDLSEHEGDDDTVHVGIDQDEDDSPAIIRHSLEFRETVDELILQARTVGCELPFAYIKFLRRFWFYGPLIHFFRDSGILWRYSKKPHLHKVSPRDGVDGYVVELATSEHGEGVVALYLDAGPTKSHAVVMTLGCSYDEEEAEKDFSNDYSTIQDTNGKTYKVCNTMYDTTLEWYSFDFETWLAGIMCYWDSLRVTSKWEEELRPGSLKREKFLEFVRANPVLKHEIWSEQIDNEVLELMLEANAAISRP